MAQQSQHYLTVREQEQISGELANIANYVSVREKLFFKYGCVLSWAALQASTLVFWRSAFRGFNLYKFNRSRLSTLAYSCTVPFQGAYIHSAACQYKLQDYFRPENQWFFAYRAMLAHQLGLLACLSITTCVTFFAAQDKGIIPIPNQYLKKGYRLDTLKYVLTQLRPYAKTTTLTWLASSAVMFAVGLGEYKQSTALLAKLNRKTLSLKED